MNSTGLTVLFDGGCSLCSREINHYRQLQALRPILWLDVTSNDERLVPFCIPREAAMAEFHVFDATGLLHKGADGFVVLWRALPYYRYLASFCVALHLLPLMRWGYARFARWHFARRCASGVCG